MAYVCECGRRFKSKKALFTHFRRYRKSKRHHVFATEISPLRRNAVMVRGTVSSVNAIAPATPYWMR